jgi:hypothetical protein
VRGVDEIYVHVLFLLMKVDLACVLSGRKAKDVRNVNNELEWNL